MSLENCQAAIKILVWLITAARDKDKNMDPWEEAYIKGRDGCWPTIEDDDGWSY